MKEKIEYIRVTDVLYPLSGLKNVPADILKNAADRGTKVHEICDAIISGLIKYDPLKIHEEYAGYIQSFMRWYPKSFIPKPDRFYCDDHGITGECDGIYRDEVGLVLVDLKTPLRESKSWIEQGSAYSYLAKKAGYDIKRIEFIRLDKKGQYPEVLVYDENFQSFLSCLYVYKRYFKNLREDVASDYV